MPKTTKVSEGEISFIDLLMKRLSSIEDITTLEEKNGLISLFKDGLKFATVKGKTIRLLDKQGSFEKIEKKLLMDDDKLLKAATRAVWIASDKI